jgi:hypothetical protein
MTEHFLFQKKEIKVNREMLKKCEQTKSSRRKSEQFAVGERKLSPLSTLITFYFSNFFEKQQH